MLKLGAAINSTVALSVVLLSIICMMILPMPAWVVDIGLACSFCLSILIFSKILFIEKPLDFSAFPTLLLASLILRLSLNVSSTKLIIGEGHTGTFAAGQVIQGFSEFVMGGNILIGLVVFGVILIVNFMVITKGAARMAEVGARFALDGMPGRQLAIDSDLSSGAITHDQAKARRETEHLETTFYGSLDGASKFVKGDALAGLLITLLNLIVGILIGVLSHGMAFGAAFETYAILTVGDGLVSQLPAVIISIAAALLLAKGGNKGATDNNLVTQFKNHPAALVTVAVLMAALGMVPGLPFFPFVLCGLALGFVAWRASILPPIVDDRSEVEQAIPLIEPIADLLAVDEIHIKFAPNLVSLMLDPATNIDGRIANLRKHVASTFGVILPEVRLTDAVEFTEGEYQIHIFGIQEAHGILRPHDYLCLPQETELAALPGDDVLEPVYQAPAKWVPEADREAAITTGFTVVAPAEVLTTHLLEVIKENLSDLLSLKAFSALLHEFGNVSDPVRAEANQKLVRDLIPEKLPIEVLHSVAKHCLDEGISIRNLGLLMEAAAEARVFTTNTMAIYEHVRRRLRRQIISRLKTAEGTLELVELGAGWEDVFQRYQAETGTAVAEIALPLEDYRRLTKNVMELVTNLGERSAQVALVTKGVWRRYLATVLKSNGLSNAVIAYEEMDAADRPLLIGEIAA